MISLLRMALRVEVNPAMMAWYLARDRERRGLSLSEHIVLVCGDAGESAEATYAKLAWCLAPRNTQHVDQIAAECWLDPFVVAGIVEMSNA